MNSEGLLNIFMNLEAKLQPCMRVGPRKTLENSCVSLMQSLTQKGLYKYIETNLDESKTQTDYEYMMSLLVFLTETS